MNLLEKLFNKKDDVVPNEEVQKATKQVVKETDSLIEGQQKVSDDTIELVKTVLRRKDELLATAVNQTGTAVRGTRRGRKHYRSAH